MSTLDPALLDAAVTLVRDLTTERATPARARDRLEPLRRAFPQVDPALLRDEEVSDGSVSFDLLLRRPEGTLSVAWSPAPALPWPLRGALRHSDHHLAKIGTRTLRVGEALAALDFLWYDHDVLARLVDTALVAAELERCPIEVSDADLQVAADAYRRAKGLLDPAATARWLADRGLTETDFAQLIADTVAVARLRERVVAGRLAEWFTTHGSRFDTLVVAWTAGAELPSDPSEALAAVADAVRAGRTAGVSRIRAQAAPAELRAASTPTATRIAGEPVTALVVAREAALLDEETRALAERAVFDEWLARARADAEVEWFWLPRQRTEPTR